MAVVPGTVPGPASAMAAAQPGACVGPNAVVQLAEALKAESGVALAREVFTRAGLEQLLVSPPGQMVPQTQVIALNDALFATVPQPRADAVAWDAGVRTARYLLAHRIPGGAQRLMQWLPPPLSARLLLRAIARNAWTFAGSGTVRCRAGSPSIITIGSNPISTPGCPWHRGVFTTLFRTLVSPATRVTETDCCARGGSVCRFELAVEAS